MTKIKYNIESKNSIINNLNATIDLLTTINNKFTNTYIPYDFYYKNSFNNLSYNLKEIKKELDNYKNDLNNYIEKINKNELELLSTINNIEELIIDKQ